MYSFGAGWMGENGQAQKTMKACEFELADEMYRSERVSFSIQLVVELIHSD